jgi:glycosyltransferase involved in cell wall biosynthesis
MRDKSMVAKKISLILPEPTPYHDILLTKLSSDGNIHLKVYYLKNKSLVHPWDIDSSQATYRTYYLDRNTIIPFFLIIKIIKDKPDLIIIAGCTCLTRLLALLSCKVFHIRFAFWSDTPNLKKQRGFIKRKVRTFILQWIFNNADMILTTGEVGVNAYKLMRCPEKKLRNLPFATDLDGPAHPGPDVLACGDRLKARFAPQGEIIFIAAGQLVPRKEYAIAIKAFHQALGAGANQPAAFLIAGAGPQQGYLQELIASLRLSDQVHLLGWRQPKEMHGVFSASSVLVHTANWDPYPNAVLEAMAWGLPVLASHQSMSAVDRVIPGESGFIHRVGDIDALAQQMQYFLQEPSRVNRMGANARLAAEQWPVSRCVQTIMDLA